jgi:hypothetical protein
MNARLHTIGSAVLLMFLAFLFGLTVCSQEKAPKPKLNADVQLELTQQQNAIYKLLLQQRALEQQYQNVTDQLAKANAAYLEKARTALKRSGIDEAKWEINTDTLDVTPKPVLTPPAVDITPKPPAQAPSQVPAKKP